METRRLRFVINVIGAVALAGHLGFAQAGKSGFSILKLGVSAQGIAMADAINACVQGAAATYYNPAALSPPLTMTSPTQVMITHREWIQDTRTEFLGARVALSDRDALGFSMNSTAVSDIEIRTRPGPAEGTFTARDFWIGASYARQFSDDVSIGATAKFLYEKILVDEASGIGVDLGAVYKTPVEHLSVGAVIANIGSLGNLRDQKTQLPTLLRLGGAYKFEYPDPSLLLTIATDFVHIFPEGQSHLNLGAEVLFNQTVAARAGYRFGSEGQKLSAGIGILYLFLGLDYAYAPLAFDLGNTHTISLSFRF